jgi:hypothetical protein
MKPGTTLVTTLFALASYPLMAQQPPPGGQPTSPAAQQQNPSGTAPATQSSQAAVPQTPALEMSPIKGELLSKLDTKTAKTGDSVVVQTKSSAKTADGTEIPKGSKLVGRVLAVHPSAAGDNSQVVLQFDHLELKGGQNMPVHTQIQSIAPASGSASTAASAPPAGGSSNPSAGSNASSAPQPASGDTAAAPAASGGPAAGTVVARTGNIAIATTSVPGVLLANNAPGQQDPRMAQASSILLGAKQDIQLDGGTQMVVGVSAAGSGGTQ